MINIKIILNINIPSILFTEYLKIFLDMSFNLTLIGDESNYYCNKYKNYTYIEDVYNDISRKDVTKNTFKCFKKKLKYLNNNIIKIPEILITNSNLTLHM